MRTALVVGINHYAHTRDLFGCVRDAVSVAQVLERNGDETETANFAVRVRTAQSSRDLVTRKELKDAINALFATDAETALFYFAGHGHVETTGGYLLASDADRGDDGVALGEILTYANRSKAKNRIIVLDSCHSGIAGARPTADLSELTEGLTILTASTDDQYATERDGAGVFTSLFVDALMGAAANLLGEITPGSVYAHIDRSLGPWEQRPVFKTNVKNFVSLRKTTPSLTLPELRSMIDLFPSPDQLLPLDPTFEPELKGRSPGMPDPDPANVQRFRTLQRYNRVNLLVPVDAPHMWNAAMDRKACRLTPLGKHYWRMVWKRLL